MSKVLKETRSSLSVWRGGISEFELEMEPVENVWLPRAVKVHCTFKPMCESPWLSEKDKEVK